MAETTEIRLPRLADSVASVRFGAWLKQEGDRVEAGEPIAEVETDKTTVELEAPAAGVLCDLRVAAGADGLEVGAVLARIAQAAGGGAGAASVSPQDAPVSEAEVQPGSGDEGAVRGLGRAGAPEPNADTTGSSAGEAVAETVPSGARAAPGDSSAFAGGAQAAPEEAQAAPAARDAVPEATPLALRMASAAGLDLSAVRAAGADGRIRKADIDRVLAARRGGPVKGEGAVPPSAPNPEPLRTEVSGRGDGPWSAPAPPVASAPMGGGNAMPGGGDAAPSGGLALPAPSPPGSAAGAALRADAEASGAASVPPHREQPLTAMRRVTATRMQQAKQTVPHFYLRIECRVDAALRFLSAAGRHLPDARPTLTDLVVRAAACALRRVPQANSAWVDGAVRVYDRVDVAVAVNTPHGLVAPVVLGADGKDLGIIARETRTLAARARAGRLAPAEYAGGTFTVSNLGMYGVESLYAIVNPPQSCILGVGAASRRPVASGDGVGVGEVMACTLSADHRVIDGAAGAELLEAIRSNLEQPALMLIPAEAQAAGGGGRAGSS